MTVHQPLELPSASMGVELEGSNSRISKKYIVNLKRSIGMCWIEMEQWDVIMCKLGDVEMLYDVWLCKVLVLLYTCTLAS
jgi:hypothetical protein